MSNVVALLVGTLVGLVTITALPYFNNQKPIFPVCLTCHNEFSVLSDLPALTRYWYRVNGNTVCIDHAKLDGAKIARLFSELFKTAPGLPPDRFLCKKRMSDLVVNGFTKYEVFCAYMGRKLRRHYLKIQTMRHTMVDHTDKRFVFFITPSTCFVDAPIGKCVKLKTQKKIPFFPNGAVRLIKHVYGPRDDSLIYIKDWRFLHRMNVNVNNPGTDMYGNVKGCGNLFVTILMTSDTYYAVLG